MWIVTVFILEMKRGTYVADRGIKYKNIFKLDDDGTSEDFPRKKPRSQLKKKGKRADDDDREPLIE